MEKFSAILALCAGNSPVTCEFPSQRPVTRSFDVLFNLRVYKRLSKQSWSWWFETQLRPWWCHRNWMSPIRGCLPKLYQCTGAKTKKPPLWIWHIHVNFIEWKLLHFFQISFKFISEDPADNKSESVQIMARGGIGAKSSSKSMMTQVTGAYIRYSDMMDATRGVWE